MKLEDFIEKNAPTNRIALLVLLDTLVVAVSGFFALYIRFDYQFRTMDMQYMERELYCLPIHILVSLVIFALFKLYRSVWRFASVHEFLNICGACGSA